VKHLRLEHRQPFRSCPLHGTRRSYFIYEEAHVTKRIVHALVIATLSTGVASAQASVMDRLQLVAPGLSATVVCETAFSNGMTQGCTLGGGGGVQPFTTYRLNADLRQMSQRFDAIGNWYDADSEFDASCGYSNSRFFRVRPDGTLEVLLRFRTCMNPQGGAPGIMGVAVDNINGVAYILADPPSVLIAVHGLPTLLDITATYQPGSGAFTWNTPKYPETLKAADRFQVFTGNIRDLPDFRRATAAICTAPEIGGPRPGDLISIPDPLPTPALGEGSYVIVGVEHEGIRRFGRQNINGVLSGRNPALFPVCD
jgi:hypothetical protein